MALIQLDSVPVVLEVPKASKEMISVSKLPDGRTKVRINSSSLDVIQTCMRKAQLSLFEGWKAETESPATLFGSAIHAALEVFYKRPPGDRKLAKLETMELMSYGHRVPGEEKDLILSATRAFIDKAQPLAPLPPEDKRSIQNGVWILSEYFKAYLNDPYMAYVDKDGPFIERKFSLVVYEHGDLVIEIFGTIDFVFQHVVTGELLGGDHKTTSMIQGFSGESYFDRDKPNHQYTFYLCGARKVFGLDIKNFAVNVVEVKSRPKTAKAKGVSFPRQITDRTEEDFQETVEAVIYSVLRYLEAIDSKVWPLGPVNACQMYAGCTYKQVCGAPKSLRQNVLNAKFKRGLNVAL